MASARNDAAQRLQQATQNADQIVQVAQAQARERLARASADTNAIVGLAQQQDPGLMLRLYRQRVPAILSRAGSVTTVSPEDSARLILQGPNP